jgi:DNA-directed RNA polymerase subunit RPC12/RpoP
MVSWSQTTEVRMSDCSWENESRLSGWREFHCVECGSPSVRIPDTLGEDDEVKCQRCGFLVSTWGSFKASIESNIG